MEKGQQIEFDLKSNFTFIKELGSGGTGKTYLLHDNTTDTLFAFKKFSPIEGNNREECYRRFIDEIKILTHISHPNIVRIYTHYLYPSQLTGFLQMEYIEGNDFNEFIPTKTFTLEDVFISCIDAFCYLETKHILHRDIRPANILITSTNQVKIIDFGFGKEMCNTNDDNSVVLNWDVLEYPNDISKNVYDNITEIFFLGELFKKKIGDSKFTYNNIIKKMTQTNRENRYSSFSEIKNEINKSIYSLTKFTDIQKNIFQTFMTELIKMIKCFNGTPSFASDINSILNEIKDVLLANSLEDTIQNKEAIINCFIKRGTNYTYYSTVSIDKKSLFDFYSFLTSLNSDQSNVVIKNIHARLSNIEVKENDLPF